MVQDHSIAPFISSRDKKDVAAAIDSYNNYHEAHGGDLAARKKEYADMVNKYYDLSTSFYEYGWGKSFHFAHRFKHESHMESIRRHEHYLALRLKLQPGTKVLDVGCGIGGPLREIAMFSDASVTGLNNNSYQISRGLHYNQQAGHGVTDRCTYVKADFMNMPFEDNSFDAVYEIDATCHAPDQIGCYKEVLRVLKPGGCFAGYEWCSTDVYDPTNPRHRSVMNEIELGNGLPDVRTCEETKRSLQAAGFEVLEAEDLALTADIPWWYPIDQDRIGLDCVRDFRTTRPGRMATHVMVNALETLRIAPKGTCEVSRMLERAADGLVAGGKLGIFTAIYFFLVRKPLPPGQTNGAH